MPSFIFHLHDVQFQKRANHLQKRHPEINLYAGIILRLFFKSLHLSSLRTSLGTEMPHVRFDEPCRGFINDVNAPNGRRQCDQLTTHESGYCWRRHRSSRPAATTYPYVLLPPNRRHMRLAGRNHSTFGVQVHKLGAMIQCPNCHARVFPEEKTGSDSENPFSLCCRRGRLTCLRNFPQYPPVMQSLLRNQHPLSGSFLNKVRHYNTLLSYASFSTSSGEAGTIPNGPSMFRVRGTVYHNIGDVALGDTGPAFGGIYIHDPEDQLETRFNRFPDVSAELLELLQQVQLQHNPFSNAYRQLGELLRQSEENGFDIPIYSMRLLPAVDQAGRQSATIADEVAVLMPGDGADFSAPHEIVVHGVPAPHMLQESNRPSVRRISCLHGAYDPLSYAMLFPFATHGWHMGLRDLEDSNGRRRKISMMDFYR